MNRRDVMITAAGSIASLSLGALAGESPAKPPARAAEPAPVNAALVEAARGCVEAGEVCLDHCIRLLSAGDTSLAECTATVRAMLPMCGTLVELATLRSPHLKALAAVCAKVCRDCEKACQKHADHHAECKACMESCQRCASECEKVAAAR